MPTKLNMKLLPSPCLQFSLPCLENPGINNSPFTWISEHFDEIQSIVSTYGMALLRKFPLYSLSEFEKITKLFVSELSPYIFRSTPRSSLGGNLYSSTEYPATEIIPLHNENSYMELFPEKIFLFCAIPPSTGGQTPIADSQIIFKNIPETIRDKFINKGIKYVRNFHNNIDLPWQEAFQTNDKDMVSKICHQLHIEFCWKNDNHLRTWQIRPAVISHPLTQQPVWFNQAHLFHSSALPSAMRAELVQHYKEEDLPRNAFFGDDSVIDVAELEEIRAVLCNHQLAFNWSRGDILILDNLRVAHGRNPYQGERKIVVTMGT